jgi:maleate isomerase
MNPTLTAAPPIRSINYGTRCKLGMMFPSANFVAEPQINAMLPPGVALHATRLHLDMSDRMSMMKRLEEATALLVDAEVDLIAFHCTGVTMWDLDVAARVKARIAACTTTPAIVTSDAIVAALRALTAKRVVIVSPYVQEVNDREAALLAHHGITVVAERALQLRGAVAYGQVTPQQWFEHAVGMRRPDADAYFLSCTAIKSAETVDALEHALGRPVITSNQAMLWFALRSAGITDAVDGFGRLFKLP